MKYRCISCDSVFEAEGDQKPRCPKCMGIHDIEKVDGPSAASPKSATKKVPLIVLGVVVAVAAVWFVTQQTNEPTEPGGKEAPAVADNLATELGLTAEEMSPCAADEAIVEYASGAVDGKKGREAVAALADALQDARRGGKWKSYDQKEPRSQKPLTAATFLSQVVLGEPEQPFEATSLELACLLSSLATTVDDDVRVVEILRFEDQQKPADGPGKYGRFGVALGSSEKDGKFEVFDPYSGRITRTVQAQPMDRATVAAAYLGHAALSLLADRLNNEARTKNDAAIRLAPANPYHRMTRGFIFLTSGIPSEAVAEFEKARKMRDDAVTRANLAEILLLADFSGRQSEEILQSVLAENPEYVRVQCMQAMVHVMRQEFDDARSRLTTAEGLEPNSPEVALFWSQFYVAQGLTEEGIEKAEMAVRLSGESEASLLSLASIYQRTARFDEMRATLDRLLAKVDSEEVRRDLARLFNYGPEDEDEEDDEDLADSAEQPASTSGFQLKLGSDGQTGFGGKPGGKGLNLNLDLNRPSN